ncbi:enoyl-CoA hydratase/isomerase family protein [Hoeflea sp.]|uniref:enoyl-CoA hydratase/isomerase family protein n=1 Tax=Hoeflea sp. TaxID=1940281 RepID=UPI003B023989
MSEEILADGGLRLSRSGSVARLTLARPNARNALTFAMWSALPDIASQLSQDDAIRVLIISGEGDQAFSAGADIKEFPATYADLDSTRRYNAAVREAQAAIENMRIPVIAEIRGACFGGGCGLALHCDLRFADDTSRFAITPAKLGLAYSFEGTRRLVSLVGTSGAKDILFSGRVLSSAEALNMHLIDFVVPQAELGATVEEYAASLCKVSKVSIEVAKKTVDAVASGADTADAALRSAFEETFSGADFAEGCAAFIEKRKPDFN